MSAVTQGYLTLLCLPSIRLPSPFTSQRGRLTQGEAYLIITDEGRLTIVYGRRAHDRRFPPPAGRRTGESTHESAHEIRTGRIRLPSPVLSQAGSPVPRPASGSRRGRRTHRDRRAGTRPLEDPGIRLARRTHPARTSRLRHQQRGVSGQPRRRQVLGGGRRPRPVRTPAGPRPGRAPCPVAAGRPLRPRAGRRALPADAPPCSPCPPGR